MLLARPEAFDTDGTLLPIGNGARVGTSSARREALLVHHRPDLHVEPLRGNVPTRVLKLRESQYDAILLACAGLIRLAGPDVDTPEDSALLQGLKMIRLDPAVFVPAPSQGAVAYQVRRDRTELFDLVAGLDASQWHRAIKAEPQVARAHRGWLPVAVRCVVSGVGRQESRDGGLPAGRFGNHGPATRYRSDRTGPGGAPTIATRKDDTLKSLHNRKILVTRAAEDAHLWTDRIEQLGGSPVALPCIRCEILDDAETSQQLKRAVASCDWLILTSVHGAQAAAQLLGAAPDERVAIAVVGEQTRREVQKLWGRVELTGDGSGACSLAKRLVSRLNGTARIVVAVGDRARRDVGRHPARGRSAGHPSRDLSNGSHGCSRADF